MESIKETLFQAFAEGEILTGDNTYNQMAMEFINLQKKIEAGKLNMDDLSSLEYVSMRAGFYAGMNAMRSLMMD